jgi:predicted transcriptional regulator
MTTKEPNMTSGQASDRDHSAGSVVYSFFQKWEQPIRSGKVRLFFRKRFPSQKPARVYFYIGSPIASVIGSAAVEKMERLSQKDALSLAEQGCISRDELASYIGERESVGAIYLMDFRLFKKPVALIRLQEKIGLLPPQNFQKLSEAALSVIEDMASES